MKLTLLFAVALGVSSLACADDALKALQDVPNSKAIKTLPLTPEENSLRRQQWESVNSPFISWNEKESIIVSALNKRGGNLPVIIIERAGGLLAETIDYRCFILTRAELIYLEHVHDKDFLRNPTCKATWNASCVRVQPDFIDAFKKVQDKLLKPNKNNMDMIVCDAPTLFISLWKGKGQAECVSAALSQGSQAVPSQQQLFSPAWLSNHSRYETLAALYGLLHAKINP